MSEPTEAEATEVETTEAEATEAETTEVEASDAEATEAEATDAEAMDPTESEATEADLTGATAPEPDPMAALREDADLAPLVEAHGPVELEPAEDLFERTVISILRQQISMDAAAAIRERLFDAIEVTPQGALAADEQVLLDAGLSSSKVEYLQNAARRFAERGYDHAYFAGMDDAAVIDELTGVAGFGPWTARMVLVFGLGREDVFPVGDLGVRHGMHEFVDPDLTRAEMVEHAERWAPYRSYVALLFWTALEE